METAKGRFFHCQDLVNIRGRDLKVENAGRMTWVATSRVSDPHPFHADPDPGF